MVLFSWVVYARRLHHTSIFFLGRPVQLGLDASLLSENLFSEATCMGGYRVRYMHGVATKGLRGLLLLMGIRYLLSPLFFFLLLEMKGIHYQVGSRTLFLRCLFM